MRIAQEEIFGPILAVIPYESDDEAVSIANDSAYGLAGSIFTSDPERGLALARRIDAGQVRVNTMLSGNGFPFGGFKNSGIGRELGAEGLSSYLEMKTIYPMDQDESPGRGPLEAAQSLAGRGLASLSTTGTPSAVRLQLPGLVTSTSKPESSPAV